MPVFNVRSPDGQLFRVTAPEGATQDEIIEYAQSQMGLSGETKLSAPPPQEGITAALTGGFKRYLSTGETALESLVNPELAAQRGVERAQRLGEQYAPGASLEKVKQAYAERGLFPAVGEAISQIPSALAEQAPQIAATLGSAKLGAMAGTAVAPGVGTIIGGLGGALAPSLMQLYGANIERQAEEKAPEISRLAALGAAAPGAALEVASTFIPLGRNLVGKLLGPNAEKALARGSNEAIERQAQEALTTSLLKGAGVGAAVEIPTEVTQQMLERLQAGLPLTTEDALKEYGEAAYGAGLVGGPFGAAARGLGRPGVRAQYEQIQQEEAARLAVPEEELAQRFPETLPGGFKIEREELGREMAPQGYSLTVEGRDEPLSIVDTKEEADAKFESLTKIRQEERENLLKEEQKINADVQKAKDRLERLEATEQTDTDEYRSLKADLPNMMDESAQKIKDLYDRSQSLSKPITVIPFGEVERVNERFKVLGPDAKEIGSFKTLGEAEAEVQGRVGEDVFKQTQQNRQVAKELYRTFVPQMRKFGLGDVGLNIVDRIENGAGGAYLNKLIRVSLEDANPVQTMRHESLHALKDLGFFTPQQWKALEERANKQWIKEYLEGQETEVDGQKMSRLEGYKKLGYTQEAIVEEAIADAFGAYDKGAKPPPGMIAALFRKIKNFFANLSQALRGAGFQSADDIFQQIERGGLKPAKAVEAKPEAKEKLSLAPKGIPQRIWDLHEKAIRADEEASERVVRPQGISPGAAKRNQTMSFRRLNKAVMEFVGGDEQKANDLMVKMNEESSRREREAEEKFSLAKPAVPLSTRPVMEGEDNASRGALGLNTTAKRGRYNNVRDIARALNNDTLGKYGAMDRKKLTDDDVVKIADAIADEVSYQLGTTAKTGTGLGWYSNNYPNAVKRLQARFPELADNQHARSVFSAIVAVTSNGEKVTKNISNAVELYSKLRDGEPMVAMGNRRATALENNLRGIERLLEDHGTDFEKHLLEEITVKDMNARLREMGEKSDGSYLADTVVPRAAIYFGPKLGAFYANLSGSEGYLTMDLWWTRSINRMRGLLIPKATDASIDKFREMMDQPSATRDEVVAASIPLRNKYKDFGFTTELEYLAGGKEPSTKSAKPEWFKRAEAAAGDAYEQLLFDHNLEKMANTIYKNEYEMLEEAPFTASDRAFMYKAARDAQAKLRKNNIDLTLADIQAALWYYEKRLYAKLSGVKADDIGYEEAIIAQASEGDGRARPSVVFGGESDAGVVTGREVRRAEEARPEPAVEEKPSGKAAKLSLKAPTTPEFKRWFGESKIVDAAGNPMPLYHATYQDFSEFRISEDGKLGAGIYLSSLPEYSESYATSGTVMPLWASVENPFVIQISNQNIEYEEAPFGSDYPKGRKYPYIANVKPIDQKLAEFVREQTGDKKRALDLTGEQLTRMFKKAGYDAILVYDEDGTLFEANVFDKDQIKSTLGNVGAYGQRPITEAEAERFGLTKEEAAKAQKRGDIRFSLKNVAFPSVKEAQEAADEVKDPSTAEFKQYIGASQWLNEDGSPKRFFHATTGNFFEFKNGVIYLSETAKDSEKFGLADEDRLRAQIYRALNKVEKLPLFQRAVDKAVADGKITAEKGEAFMRDAKRKIPDFDKYGAIKEEVDAELIGLAPERMKIMPLYARAETPFDFRNPDHVAQVLQQVDRGEVRISDEAMRMAKELKAPSEYPDHWYRGLAGLIKQGYPKTIEDERVQRAIRRVGFDGYITRPNRSAPLTYAVYKPQQLKSVTGNDGQFSLETKDVRYSLKNVRYTPERFDELVNKSMYLQGGDENKTKGYLAFVNPLDFVKATSTPEEFARVQAEQELLDFEKMGKLDTPKLDVSIQNGEWKITNHSGRHRMLSMHDAGYRDVPVFIEFATAIDDAKPIPVKMLKAQSKDSLNSILMAGEVEPLSYTNGPKVKEKFTDAESVVKFSLPTLSKATMDRIKEVAPGRVNLGWQDRVIGAFKQDFTGLRQRFLNRYETLGVYDRALREKIRKAGGPELLADQSAEFAALQSDLSAGVAASAMGIGDRQGGVPVYRNGFTTIDNSVKGLTEALAPLAKFSGSQKEGEPDIYSTYQFWAGWKRGRRLLREGREQLYTAADEKKAQEIEAAHPEFVQVQKDLIAFNNGIVNYAVQTGVLSRERAQVYTQYADYIPFYRQLELDKTIGPNPFSGISGQKGPKALKGGEGVLGDFLENMVRNTQSMINAGMKNAAAQKATKVALEINEVERLPGPAKGLGVDVYTVLENGQLVYYRANDKLFIDSLASLNMPDLPFIGLLSGPANALRNLVTKDPGFMMANLLRDSLSSYVTSGQKVTPIVGTMVNFGKALAGKDPKLQALFNAGVIGGYEFSQNIEQSGETLSADLNKKAGKDAILLRPFKSLWEGLEKGTTASDAATRMAVYERVMKETGNEAEAISRALEVMNFNRKGNNVLIRVATAALPFFNARLQGLDLFYRASMGQMNTTDAAEIKKRFWIRGATMMALSVMYYISVADDDEYEKQEEETKDNNWIFPSVGIRVPIPFEVGTLFKTMPERITALLMGNDTGKDFKESTVRALINTFGFNPIPQTFKPIIEAATNYNFFTMRPIVGQGMQDVAPQFQVGPGTSKTAEFIGQKLNLSPLKIDQLIKGYTGTMGGYLVDVIDSITNEFADIPKASKRFEQMPVIKRFALDPEARGSVTQFYELQKSVDTFVRTSNLLEKTARPEEYAKYVQDNLGLLVAKDYVSSVEKEMKKLRDTRKVINSSDMPSDEKRDLLVDIGRLETSLTANIKTIKRTVSELK